MDPKVYCHICCAEAESSPTSKSPVGFKSWKDQAQSCVAQDAKLRKMWLEPDWMGFKVRSKNYLQTKLKETTESPRKSLYYHFYLCNMPPAATDDQRYST